MKTVFETNQISIKNALILEILVVECLHGRDKEFEDNNTCLSTLVASRVCQLRSSVLNLTWNALMNDLENRPL